MTVEQLAQEVADEIADRVRLGMAERGLSLADFDVETREAIYAEAVRQYLSE